MQPGKMRLTVRLTIVLVAVLEITLIYYFEIYLNKIRSIDSISIEVKQHSSFQLPRIIEARLKSNDLEKVAVKWESELIDTDKVGTINLEGRVEGYSEAVILEIKVYEYIEALERPRIVALISEGSPLEFKDLRLPEELSVVYGGDRKGREKVLWKSNYRNITQAGNYEIKGIFESDIPCELEAVCLLEVIDREELIKRIFVQNLYLEEGAVQETVSKVIALPNSILEALLQAEITISYVEGNITDIPEFESLKKHEDERLKVFGAFRYPHIVVDYEADKYVRFTELDNLATIVLHEIGHAYDFLLKGEEKLYLSSGDEFFSIWKSEAENLFRPSVTNMAEELNNYYISYSYEYFAECFAFYFQNERSRELLKENAPRTYDFIERLHGGGELRIKN